MTPIALYAAYRSTPLSPAETHEFNARFGAAPEALITRAIRETADATGYVRLDSVAHRVAVVREAIFRELSSERDQTRRKHEPSNDPKNLSWPTKPNGTTGDFLAAIACFAVMALGDDFGGAECAERYVRGGYVLQEHADEVLAAARKGSTGVERDQLGSSAAQAIEARLGSWASRRAVEYVAAARDRRQQS